jgi:mono/diheme cytochrome c family protein
MHKFLLVLLLIPALAQAQGMTYNLGRSATEDEIRLWDIAINPGDGQELPEGKGSVVDGEKLYATKCLACHGVDGGGAQAPRIVGRNTIGSNWPFATSVWSYINRAMPLYLEGSLSPDEVYALTAFLLYKNNIIPESSELNQDNLAEVEMPNRNGYVPPPIDQWEPGMPRLFKIIGSEY